MKLKQLILLLVAVCMATVMNAQNRIAYVAAKSGLSIREKPAVNAKVLDKIPYGTRLVIAPDTAEAVSISTEGLLGYWEKVTWNNKTGYIVNSYLLPIAPPKQGLVKEMKDYFKQSYIPFGSKLAIKQGERNNIEEGGYYREKQLYKNGAEHHHFEGYEYGSDTWFLPDFTLQQGFLLLRLIPEFKLAIPETAEFPSESKTIKRGESEVVFTVDKEVFGDNAWVNRIRVEFEDGAFYNLEIYQVENDLVIFFGSGV